jgi:hypothetical protein
VARLKERVRESASLIKSDDDYQQVLEGLKKDVLLSEEG